MNSSECVACLLHSFSCRSIKLYQQLIDPSFQILDHGIPMHLFKLQQDTLCVGFWVHILCAAEKFLTLGIHFVLRRKWDKT